VIAIVAATIAIILLARYLPRTSLYRRFALVTSNPAGPSLDHQPRQFATGSGLTPGAQGVTVSMLRPSGKARFSDQLVDVITEGEFVPPETPITIIQTDGMRVVVKPSAA
jgi:membrane-bound serine protease (ClpP class)